MTEPDVFSFIPVRVPPVQVWKRLGYRKETAFPGGEQAVSLQETLTEAFSLMEIQGAGLPASFRSPRPGDIRLAGGAVFHSGDLARFLRGCDDLLLMGATAGQTIMTAIEEASRAGRMARAAVLDAAASEAVDGALDWITGYYRRKLLRKLKTVTGRRFSAGYGDFSLENQKIIYELLRLGDLSVTLTDTFMLIPEKSVTAVAGIMNIDSQEALADEAEEKPS